MPRVALERSVDRIAAGGRILLLVDVGVAVAICAALLFADTRALVTSVDATTFAVRTAGIIVASLTVASRRIYPRWSFVVAILAAGLVASLGGPAQTSICITMTAYLVAAIGEFASWWFPPAAASVVIACAIAVGQDPSWLAALVAAAAIVSVGWFMGQVTRERRSRILALTEQRAERERQHIAELRQAAIDERLVIARELHDIVAHAMSVIAVRAGVARMVMDSDPVEVKEALGIIETTTRQALQEMRLLVDVLRHEPDSGAALAPTPGLSDVTALAEQTRRAGIDLSVEVRGPARTLPAGVELSAYRIAQEALTNVVRHAGPTRARLRIEYRAKDLLIDVVDEGPTERTTTARLGHQASTGHGLIGMSERVALFDGDLRAGAHGAGFQVHALLRTGDAGS